MNTEKTAVAVESATNAKIKTETCACDHNEAKVVFKRKAGPAGAQKDWPVTDTVEIDLTKIPDRLVCNDGSFTSLKAYGARALLMDRASDFRKFGALEYMREMDRLYKELLLNGRFDAERKASGPRIDPALVQAVAAAKGLDLATAQAAVAKLSEDQRAAIAGKLATEIAAIKAAKVEVADDLLADLL